MRHVLYVLCFLLGGAVGIWVGVHHPVAAANIASDEDREKAIVEQRVAQAKIDLLQKFQGGNKVDVQPMIDQEQKNLDAANQKLAPANP